MKKSSGIIGVIGVAVIVAGGFFARSAFPKVASFFGSVGSHGQVAAVSDFNNELAGYWPFDDGSGTTAADSSRNGNTGTLVNGPTWTTGIVGSGALSFNGTNQYVDLPNSASLNPSSITISAWVYLTQENALQFVFEKSISYGLRINASNNAVLVLATANNAWGYAAVGATTLSMNKWYLLTATYVSGTADIYVNGTLDDSETTYTGNIDETSTDEPQIGGGEIQYSNYYLGGDIDDVRIYNSALSSGDVAQLYALGVSASSSALPSVPTNLASSSVQTTQAAISWSASTDASTTNSVAGYTVYRGGTEIATTSSTSYTDTDLSPDTTYSYTVSAYDNASPANSSSQSSLLSITTSAIPLTSNIYISENGGGALSGSDCSDALPVSWLNTSANWGMSNDQIGPGDTVNICGTVTSPISIQGSGTSGHPITIYFQPGAVMSAPYWGSGGAISAANLSYITIDGGTNGEIEATENGSTLEYQQQSIGIQFTGMSNLIIKDLSIQNMYVHTPGVQDTNSSPEGDRLGGGINGDGSNITIQNNNIAGGDTLIGLTWGSNLLINSSTLSDCNHGITIGNDTPGTVVSNVVISNNRIDHLDLWNNPYSGNDLHLDGMIIFNEGGATSSLSGLQIYRNDIGPNIGTENTAAVFLDGYEPTDFPGFAIYDNIFTGTSTESWTNGFIAAEGNPTSVVANNTFISSGGDAPYGTGEGSQSYNNLMYDIGVGAEIFADSSNTVNDYNLYDFSSNGVDMATRSGVNFNFYYDLASWRLATGWDLHSSSTSDPLLVSTSTVNGNFHLSSASPAIGAGANLTSDCGSFPTLCQDYDGNPRPTSGPWDIGAYQYCLTDCNTNPDPGPDISDISTSDISWSGATITWSTDEPASSQVQYDTDTSYGSQSALSSAQVTSHSVLLSGLSAGTTYHYRVISTDGSGVTSTSSDQTFTTSAASNSGGSTTGGGGSVSLSGGGGGPIAIISGGTTATTTSTSTATAVTPSSPVI